MVSVLHLEKLTVWQPEIIISSNHIVGFFSGSHLVYCKSCCRVGELSDQRCRESVVESQEALGPGKKVWGGWEKNETSTWLWSLLERLLLCFRPSLSAAGPEAKSGKRVKLDELESNLDEVKGVSTAGSSSACEPSKVPATHPLLLRHPASKTESRVKAKGGDQLNALAKHQSASDPFAFAQSSCQSKERIKTIQLGLGKKQKAHCVACC